jgi:hypothetical protein
MIRRLGITGAVLSLGLVTASQAEVLQVTADGTGEYATIQSAVDAAVNGDIVLLSPGTYQGDGNRDVDLLGKTITVRSESGRPDDTIVDCGSTPDDPHRAFRAVSGEGMGAAIEGLGVRNGSQPHDAHFLGGGIVVAEVSHLAIRNCVIQGCEDGGVTVFSSSAVVVESSLIVGNLTELTAGGGVLVDAGSTAEIVGSTIAGNRSAYYGGGIHSGFVCNVTITRSIVYGNCADLDWDDVSTDTGSVTMVDCSIVRFAEVGGFGDVAYVDSVQDDPEFCGPGSCLDAPAVGGDYTVSDASPATPENSPCGARIGARDPACDAVPVTSVSWGRLKARSFWI